MQRLVGWWFGSMTATLVVWLLWERLTYPRPDPAEAAVRLNETMELRSEVYRLRAQAADRDAVGLAVSTWRRIGAEEDSRRRAAMVIPPAEVGAGDLIPATNVPER